MKEILGKLIAYGEHNYLDDLKGFTQKITTETYESVKKWWFYELDDKYRNAFTTLDYDISLMTTTLFFSRFNNFSSDYEHCLMEIIHYLTASNVYKEWQNNCFNVSDGLSYGTYNALKRTYNEVLEQNNSVLSILPTNLRCEVIWELLNHNTDFRYYSKALVKDLQEYRKNILHTAISTLVKELKQGE